MIKNNKIERMMGPSGTFAGYSLMVFGAIGTYFSITGLILIVAGMLMAFTYEGTLIDSDTRRIKCYTSLFGLFKTGKWYNADDFSKFHIYRSRRSSTTYSRGNVPLTIKSSDIRLALLNESGSQKIIINKYDSFESARREMSELIRDLKLTGLDEWKKP
jgi:hypothetical protein